METWWSFVVKFVDHFDESHLEVTGAVWGRSADLPVVMEVWEVPGPEGGHHAVAGQGARHPGHGPGRCLPQALAPRPVADQVGVGGGGGVTPCQALVSDHTMH